MRHKQRSPRWEMGKCLTQQPLLPNTAQVGYKSDPWVSSSCVSKSLETHTYTSARHFDVLQDNSTAPAQIYIHTHIYMFVQILVQGEARPLCPPQVARWWSGLRRWYCALTQKLTHHQQSPAHISPLLPPASALQIRRQSGNEGCCALVNELITLRHHCQFCFCSPEVITSQDLAAIAGWLQRRFKMCFWTKAKS